MLATRSGFHLFDPETGATIPIADPEASQPDSRFNDGATDPRGRFWAGTMKDRGEPRPAGSFWRLDPDLTITEGGTGFWTSNGLAFAPDGRTIYFSDSHPSVRMIWRAAYDAETGIHAAPEPFFDTRAVAGRPGDRVKTAVRLRTKQRVRRRPGWPASAPVR